MTTTLLLRELSIDIWGQGGKYEFSTLQSRDGRFPGPIRITPDDQEVLDQSGTSGQPIISGPGEESSRGLLHGGRPGLEMSPAAEPPKSNCALSPLETHPLNSCRCSRRDAFWTQLNSQNSRMDCPMLLIVRNGCRHSETSAGVPPMPGQEDPTSRRASYVANSSGPMHQATAESAR